ncbi:hypothetical protein MUY27_15740 [Mucilaginibacter sp. RS28]|uniref:Periplasmic heavy metal sensor n=1 Tax=Mucilaginibacter straminoryzae TaxID=2932774 RepID=A0A9X2BCP4_9SPHI|nr:hypothetical protein [Mucilaginibacter straminoryzae]MCJ8211172.1 hypothetical protein [Mucilaginibacter straminoryzae]
MKKIFLMGCFLLGFTALTFAQGRMRMSPEDRVKQLQTALKLTDDQSAKVLALYQAQGKKMDSLRNAANGDFQSMRPAMQAMNQETNTKLMALLTDDQKTAYKKMMEEMRARMQQNGGGTPPPSK